MLSSAFWDWTIAACQVATCLEKSVTKHVGEFLRGIANIICETNCSFEAGNVEYSVIRSRGERLEVQNVVSGDQILQVCEQGLLGRFKCHLRVAILADGDLPIGSSNDGIPVLFQSGGIVLPVEQLCDIPPRLLKEQLEAKVLTK